MTAQAEIYEAADRRAAMYERLGVWLFVAILLFVAIGTSPFSALEVVESPADGGNFINRVTWVTFAIVSLALGFARDSTAALRLFVRAWPAWLVIGWALLSFMWADHPDLAVRRSVRLAIVAVTGFGLALTMPDPKKFMPLMLVVTGIVLTINVLGSVALPHIAVSESGYRGMHSHKNTAGQVTLVAVLAWMVAAAIVRDVRARMLVTLGAVAWAGFLVLTQSKTSLGAAAIVPLALIAGNMVMRAERLPGRALAALFFSILMALWFAMLALGLDWTDFALFFFDDLTFTGRTSLWSFISTEIRESPWLGVGYGSFWQTGLRFSPLEYTREWFNNASQSHNGYLDLILHLGFIGLGLGLLAIVQSLVAALRLLGRPNIGTAEQGAYLMAMAFLLGIMVMNFMETSYFRSAGYLGTIFLFVYFAVIRWGLDAPESATDSEEAGQGPRLVAADATVR